MAKFSSENLSVDFSEFQRKAKALARVYGIDEKSFIKEQSGLLAREAARFTPPYISLPKFNGTSVGTAKDIKLGKTAVFYDLLKICSPRKAATIKWAQKSFKGGGIYSGRERVARGIIETESELNTWHSSQKKQNGRTRKLAKSDRPWVSQVIFNRYLKKEQAEVGTAKAAFVRASMGFDAKGAVPLAVKKNLLSTSGKGTLIKTSKGWDGNIQGRADGLFHTVKFMPQLMTNRLKKAIKRLEYIGKNGAKKAGFKTR